MDLDLLAALSNASGVPGREERIRQIILDYSSSWWSDVLVDPMGSLIARLDPRGPRSQKATKARPRNAPADSGPRRVMVSCHMDEIGFYVKHIDKEGWVRLHPQGGFDARTLFNKRVTVHGRRDLLGLLQPATKPIHISTDEERRKIPEPTEFYVDLLMPAREVQKLVRVGDPVTLRQEFADLGAYVSGKALDNRSAVFVGLMACKKLLADPKGFASEIHFVGSVQEEVGLRGAMAAAGRIRPDVGIAVDTTLACDTPGCGEHEAITRLGRGAGIKVLDSSAISDATLVDEFVTLAERNRIAYQMEILPRGGTDQGAIQRAAAGCKSITLSIPTRYIHTVNETQAKADLQSTIDLLAAYLAG